MTSRLLLAGIYMPCTARCNARALFNRPRIIIHLEKLHEHKESSAKYPRGTGYMQLCCEGNLLLPAPLRQIQGTSSFVCLTIQRSKGKMEFSSYIFFFFLSFVYTLKNNQGSQFIWTCNEVCALMPLRGRSTHKVLL